MSVRAVTDYVTSNIDGRIVAPFDAIDARAELPVQDIAGLTPKVYIWPITGHEDRFAFAGRANGKRVVHRLWVSCIIAMNTNPKPANSMSFRDLLEGLMQLLRTMPENVTITDSVTGLTSQLLKVGEEMDYHYEAPTLVKGQRQVAYSGAIECLAEELRIFG